MLAVSLKIENDHFLISAAHVFAVKTTEVSILTERALYSIGGELNVTNLSSSGSKRRDNVDIAILKIDDAELEKIYKKYRFLCLDDLLLNFTLPNGPQYLAVGYPVTKTKINPVKLKVKPLPFVFATKPADDRLYDKLNFERFSHVLVEYDKQIRSIKSGAIMTGPAPYGMSGAGLWYLPDLFPQKDIPVPRKLIGVLIEYRKDENVMVATRIDLIIEAIRQKYCPQILPSQIVKVNLSTE